MPFQNPPLDMPSPFQNLKGKWEKKTRENLVLIKRALSQETKETKEMIQIYAKHSMGESTPQEMKKANKQFRSFLKTLGLGTFAVLPFAPLTIPAIIKLGEKFGIDILPNSLKKK